MDSFYQDLEEVFGENTSTIRQYLSAEYYENNVLQKEYYPYQINSWDSNFFYGLVNSEGDAIFPKNNALSNHVTDANVLFRNLFFVTDAWEDLKKYHRTFLKDGNRLDKENFSLYINPQAVEATEDLDNLYLQYTKAIVAGFNSFVNIPSFNINIFNLEKIYNINSFSRVFSLFIKTYTKFAPFTRSQFILSKYSKPNINGLTIFLDRKTNFADYEQKSTNYINDPNFLTFLDSAKRYGFFVDKNAPWKIVADLGSQVMLSYANRYGMRNTQDILNNFYHIAYESDLDNMRNIIIALWNNYASNNSLSIQNKNFNNCAGYFSEVSIKKIITIENFENSFPKEWQLRMLFYIKLHENKIDITQKIFELFYEEIIKIYKYVNLKSSISFMNNKIKELKQKTSELTKADPLATVSVANSINNLKF